ncbi:SMC-Scp complex subunit ScpB [Dyella tabacisoli]|uniref:SMC-Scp complex subunit ScpB n=1 Tax=Dyella tabacisoli TaxID=2282381 RepID=A0A369UXU8_9GAMM|nr:SMC-Scp complex subunit ScpB [Dyella tabacisoli]RDD83169.1 SMC-Scp complex subunit ScpB [Dyella tabacisoli]
MQIEQLKPILEAALLASTHPMTVQQLGDLFSEEDEVGREQIAIALEALAADCEGRGVHLLEVASGFRYQVRQEVHPWISRMWTEKPSRYSRALLETLALIAYRQPITRPEIEQIRGVVVSSNIIKTMEEREWIRVVGYRDVPGKPALFGTTRAFLDYFNLKSLDELPPLSEIRDMEDPQMRLDQEPMPVYVARDLPIDPDEDIESTATDPAETGIAESIHHESAETVTDTAADEHAHSDNAEAPAIEAPSNEPSPETDPSSTSSKTTAAELDKTHPVEVTTTATADEAANLADAEPGNAEQETKEYRA